MKRAMRINSAAHDQQTQSIRNSGGVVFENASGKAAVIRANIGRLVRLIRERHEWRQVDLAIRAGVAANTVTGLEAGRKTHQRNIEKIAKALGTTADKLARGEMPEELSGLEALAAASAKGRDYSDEALQVAAMHDKAPTAIRAAALTLYSSGRRDITERLARLDPHRQAEVLEVLGAEEREQFNAHRPLSTHNRKIEG